MRITVSRDREVVVLDDNLESLTDKLKITDIRIDISARDIITATMVVVVDELDVIVDNDDVKLLSTSAEKEK